MADHNFGANAGDQGRKAYSRGRSGGYGGRYDDDRYGGGYDDGYWTDQRFNNTQGELVDTPLGQIKGMHHQGGGNSYGGTHHTVYGDGQRISWDTDGHGDYVDGSVHQNAN